ncbi:hypothetical protein SAMN00017405_0080 [Desulfonispora thiosulfatigenes DSM 11270]|uniref:Uncharacterized protein n=1 Tax=Desulfonispora thiosulfatigenes DSM 11270 TaxID=656914 RepID=A0A1W1VL80_DESTI|nr:hypothetical protein [Desulfonispora thiosulfatigenes]SMB93714.1 hypothetical protein SAMN00017405_0080 [Desulfonispora thiosulfatigenes DSM 11270]
MKDTLSVIVFTIIGVCLIVFGVWDIIKQKRILYLDKEFKLRLFIYVFAVSYPIFMIIVGILFILLTILAYSGN